VIVRYQTYLEGPRWAFGVSTIYDFAHAYGLKVEDIREFKGLLHKTITFTLVGEQDAVARCGRAVAKSVEQWNAC
jgi:hypothetical protein